MVNKLAEKAVDLWNNNKVLFFILLPLCLVAIGIKYYLDYLEFKSQKDFEKTVEKTNKIKVKKKEAIKKSNEAKAKADKIEKEIKEAKEDDIDINWHLED